MRLKGNMVINQNGFLEIGGIEAVKLADIYGTPLYVIDEKQFRENCRKYLQAFKKDNALVIYAGKALLNLAICRIINEEGLGLDIVSEGELYTALQSGFPMDKVLFHGNNKSFREIQMALEVQVGRIVADNVQELIVINELAKTFNRKADVLLRVTPGVEAHTHEYIKTGQIDSKFGFGIQTGQAGDAVKIANNMDFINLTGLHCHIGSQIIALEPYICAVEEIMNFAGKINKQNNWYPFELNMGGGLGISYRSQEIPPTINHYADRLYSCLEKKAKEHKFPTPTLMVEPGRSICGDAGCTLYTVGTIKKIPGKRKYIAVDGGMADNIRPALYQANYDAIIANKANAEPKEVVTIAGRCCESGDLLIKDIALPATKSGDTLAVLCTGAYNYSMSMNYNRIPKPAMVLVGDGKANLILKRESLQDLIRNDLIPEHLLK